MKPIGAGINMSKINECKCTFFTPIEGFDSIEQFDDVEKCVERMVAAYEIQEVPVEKTLSIVKIEERWFQCSCGNKWRLVYPDFPFRGFWGRVE